MRFVSITAAVTRFFATTEVRENIAAVSFTSARILHQCAEWMHRQLPSEPMPSYSGLPNPCWIGLPGDNGKHGSRLGQLWRSSSNWDRA
ncbi:hypothetical protein Q31b_13660 [Novipirellula aureliae]|uniref:Uncharacterized protein n=1 Tax=Novipirellula aureliae TaxID=2527966 RepID=A0A5C6E5M2_9BACT|nr:hypothetical protein [Novipirellula aureliae]TWU43834.1 hypothetical protein Q31b_13660 [Novipirellula aureliae]